ncbi:MAG: hypothetical protein WCJ07_12915 [Verrucomicrobiota bacterium]
MNKTSNSSNNIESIPLGSQDIHVNIFFTRQQIESGNTPDFLKSLSRQNMPSGPALAQLAGTVTFGVIGYGDDPRLDYEIPEIRSFYTDLDAAWPYWGFFCDLAKPNLKVITFCIIQNMQAIKTPMAAGVTLTCPIDEIERHINRLLHHTRELCERAGMNAWQTNARESALMNYFISAASLIDLPITH